MVNATERVLRCLPEGLVVYGYVAAIVPDIAPIPGGVDQSLTFNEVFDRHEDRSVIMGLWALTAGIAGVRAPFDAKQRKAKTSARYTSG